MMRAKSLDRVLNRDALLGLAGERYFERGVGYYHDGRVRSLAAHEGTVAAKVLGTEEYRVRLWVEEGDLDYSCDCPLGMDGAFCKHCVAVGLAWLGGASADTPETTMNDVKTYLEGLGKGTLVRMVIDHAMEDDGLRDRLLLRAARMGGFNIAAFHKAIDDALDFGEFPEYLPPWEFARGIENIVASIGELHEEGYASEVVELAEYALAAVEGIMNYDVEGSMGDALYDLEELHHKACKRAAPDPEALAKRLFEWELGGDYDTFSGALNTYADVLGERGISAYRRLAEAEWANVPALGPDPEKAPRYYGRRARLTHIMETLARRSGNAEDLVAIESRDLTSPYSYLRIAEIYAEAGDDDKALEWAEEGLWVFPGERHSGLSDFVAERYHARGRHEEAMELAFSRFAESPDLGHYQWLKNHADRAGDWAAWREKALSRVREDLVSMKQESQNWYLSGPVDHSELVRIYLWEGEVEAAWREAKEGGCSDGLWIELAGLREEYAPQESLEIYFSRIEPLIQQTNNKAYEEAYALLLRSRELMKRLGREWEFAAYLEIISLEYKRKRNFMKLLDGME